VLKKYLFSVMFKLLRYTYSSYNRLAHCLYTTGAARFTFNVVRIT